MKKIYTTLLLASAALGATAQVTQSELAGKYHFKGDYNIWEERFEDQVYAHDDFVFNLVPQSDGTFQLYTFFYNGMNEQFQRLGYGATATFSPAEQLLYVYQTPWLWDEYFGQYMESYGYGENNGPMMYFQVKKDPKTGLIKMAATENSLGFYFYTMLGGQSSFYYAIDYPGVVSATQVKAYSMPAGRTCEGDYVMTYTDLDGHTQTTTFTIAREAEGLVLYGMFGDNRRRIVHEEAGRTGIYILLERDEKAGYYVNYFGSNVGDCRVSFSYDADFNLVSDNYFSYSPDFRNWVDAFDAIAVPADKAEGISTTTVAQKAQRSYDLAGRSVKNAAAGQIIVRDGKKILR